MILSVNINTSREISYLVPGSDKKTRMLNKKDEENQTQLFNFQITDFNYRGSLSPLIDMISTWVKEKNEGEK